MSLAQGHSEFFVNLTCVEVLEEQLIEEHFICIRSRQIYNWHVVFIFVSFGRIPADFLEAFKSINITRLDIIYGSRVQTQSKSDILAKSLLY